MTPSRLLAFALVAASALGCAGNPAPVYDAGADRTLLMPCVLSHPGSQVKVRMPDLPDAILVWRTEIGFSATSIRCTYCGTEVWYNAGKGRLDCSTRRCGYALDGTVLHGPNRKPLRAYVVDFDGVRLRILG